MTVHHRARAAGRQGMAQGRHRGPGASHRQGPGAGTGGEGHGAGRDGSPVDQIRLASAKPGSRSASRRTSASFIGVHGQLPTRPRELRSCGVERADRTDGADQLARAREETLLHEAAQREELERELMAARPATADVQRGEEQRRATQIRPDTTPLWYKPLTPDRAQQLRACQTSVALAAAASRLELQCLAWDVSAKTSGSKPVGHC